GRVVVTDRAREEAEVRDGARDVDAARERDGLAGVERLELGELVEAGLEGVGHGVAQIGALGRGPAAPGALEGGAGGADGAVDVFRAGVGDGGDALAGGGRQVVDGAAGQGREVRAADVVEQLADAHDRLPTSSRTRGATRSMKCCMFEITRSLSWLKKSNHSMRRSSGWKRSTICCAT